MGLGKAARAYRADHAVDGDLRIAPSRLKSAANPAGLLPQLPSQPSSLSYVPLSSSPPLLTRPQRSHSEASLLHLTPRPTNKGAPPPSLDAFMAATPLPTMPTQLSDFPSSFKQAILSSPTSPRQTCVDPPKLRPILLTCTRPSIRRKKRSRSVGR
jgi:hypothetical protein